MQQQTRYTVQPRSNAKDQWQCLQYHYAIPLPSPGQGEDVQSPKSAAQREQHHQAEQREQLAQLGAACSKRSARAYVHSVTRHIRFAGCTFAGQSKYCFEKRYS